MPSKSQSILLGSFVAVALSLVQLFLVTSGGGGMGAQMLQTAVCCLIGIGGAGVAVWHYTSENNLTLPAGTGAGIGAAATSLGYVISYVIGMVLQAIGIVPSDAEILETARENALRQNPEMSAEQLAARILSEASEVPSEQIRRGDMNETEFRRFVEAAKSLEACPLFIDDTPALPIAQLAARARRLKRTHGLDVLVVDYLQLVRGTGRSENRVNEISEITMGLKAIAKELDIPVIALSQLSRQVESREDKRPQLSDLRESGSIEQDADVVMFVFREEYYKEREKPGDHELEKVAAWQEEMERLHGRAELIIGKQRHGPIGTVEMSFEGRFTRFGNLVKPWQAGGDGF